MLHPWARKILTLLLISMSLASAAQEKWPSTLLWRITGNNLSKPSFLFGTMHLQDKRLFNFSDSLYRYLEQAEGFAMEINFQEYIDSLMFRTVKQKQEEMLSDEDEVKIDEKNLSSSADTLLTELGLNKNKLTRKQLKKIREYRIRKFVQQGEMPTIVDAYLYGLALRQGKWLGGIEDVKDQLDIVDEVGASLSPDEVFTPEDVFRRSMEQMIRIYLDQDLNKLEQYCYASIGDMKDRVLIQRNIKMAQRMDSLGHIRSTFFAVGAAHLPGDSGVISFLRKMGYKVDPVFSTGKMPAAEYASKLTAVPWNKVSDKEQLYSVEMPGAPTEYDVFGDLLKMNMFFDITTMTFYMTGSTLSGSKNQKELDEILQAVAKQTGGETGRLTSRKKFQQDGLNGVEGMIQNEQGFYRLQLLQKNNVLYMLMAGSNKKLVLGSTDVVRFFGSFKAYAPVKKDWMDFDLEGKGFTVSLPGQPKVNKLLENQADGSNWKFTVYDHVDINSGLYFMVQVRDLVEGYFLDGDSVYFTSFKEGLSGKFDQVIRDSVYDHEGFPALLYHGFSKKDNLNLYTFNLLRGNRVYTLMCASTMQGSAGNVEQFLNSFRLKSYQPASWKTSGEYGFQTSSPKPIKKVVKKEEDDEEAETREHFLSFDDQRIISYEIFRDPLPSFHWYPSDSVLFEKKLDQLKSENDSVLSKKFTQNGGLKGIEVLIRGGGSNNLKKMRILMNGDTLYSLIAFIPKPYLSEKEHQRFFDDFRVAAEKKPTVFDNRSKQLMEALRNGDSTEFAKAMEALRDMDFTAEDLPSLHQGLLVQFREADQELFSVHERICTIISGLRDPSSVAFIRENYLTLKGVNENLKYPLLKVLARVKTAESYQLLGQLLKDNLPTSGSADQLTYALIDSLELTRSLYPEILSLGRDSAFCEVLVTVSNTLIDSSLLKLTDIQPLRKNFQEHAEKILNQLRDSSANWWTYYDWVSLAGKFNDVAGNHLLQRFLRLPFNGLKENAIRMLITNLQPVDPKEILKVAADKQYRLELYDGLEKLGRLKDFPKVFANQKSLAEAEMFAIASDEINVAEVRFIGEKIASFRGEKHKFYLFEVIAEKEDEEEGNYLGIAGPYLLKPGKLLTSSDAGGIYWEDFYQKDKIDLQFKEHLKEWEDWLNEQKK